MESSEGEPASGRDDTGLREPARKLVEKAQNPGDESFIRQNLRFFDQFLALNCRR
jgi:hypothetical protein